MLGGVKLDIGVKPEVKLLSELTDHQSCWCRVKKMQAAKKYVPVPYPQVFLTHSFQNKRARETAGSSSNKITKFTHEATPTVRG